MVSYLLGFILVSRKRPKGRLSVNERPKLVFPKIKSELVIIADIAELCHVSDRSWWFCRNVEIKHILEVRGNFCKGISSRKFCISTPCCRPSVQTSLACVATLYILQSKRGILRQITGWTGLLISSLSSISSFSRGAGFSFLIFAFLSMRYTGRKAVIKAIVSFAVAGYLGSVGLNERGSWYPGLGNFLDAALATHVADSSKSKENFPLLNKNSLDAMAPWSRKTEAAYYEKSSVLVMAPRFLWNLNPLPSEFFPIAPLGRDLAEIMRTYGSVWYNHSGPS